VEGLTDEAKERLEHARVGAGRPWLRPERAEHAGDHVGMNGELPRDCAALPVLGEVQAADLCLAVEGDGHRDTSPNSVIWRRARKSPSPPTVLPRRRRPRMAMPTS